MRPDLIDTADNAKTAGAVHVERLDDHGKFKSLKFRVRESGLKKHTFRGSDSQLFAGPVRHILISVIGKLVRCEMAGESCSVRNFYHALKKQVRVSRGDCIYLFFQGDVRDRFRIPYVCVIGRAAEPESFLLGGGSRISVDDDGTYVLFYRKVYEGHEFFESPKNEQ